MEAQVENGSHEHSKLVGKLMALGQCPIETAEKIADVMLAQRKIQREAESKLKAALYDRMAPKSEVWLRYMLELARNTCSTIEQDDDAAMKVADAYEKHFLTPQ